MLTNPCMPRSFALIQADPALMAAPVPAPASGPSLTFAADYYKEYIPTAAPILAPVLAPSDERPMTIDEVNINTRKSHCWPSRGRLACREDSTLY